MKYLIYTDESEAISRNEAITIACNFQDNITKNYSDIIKHVNEDKWALIIDPNYEQYFTEHEKNSAVELTEDWFPVIV